MIAAIELVRIVHRRLVLREEPTTARAQAPEPGSGTERGLAAVITTTVAVLSYVFGILATGFGILVFLGRYDPDVSASAFSLAGAAIALFGLLVFAVAAGIRRGSGLSRLLLTLFLGVVLALSAIVLVFGDRWDWGAAVTAVVAALIVVLLWTPPVARGFRPVLESSMGSTAP